jgi:hypothetical protein
MFLRAKILLASKLDWFNQSSFCRPAFGLFIHVVRGSRLALRRVLLRLFTVRKPALLVGYLVDAERKFLEHVATPLSCKL